MDGDIAPIREILEKVAEKHKRDDLISTLGCTRRHVRPRGVAASPSREGLMGPDHPDEGTLGRPTASSGATSTGSHALVDFIPQLSASGFLFTTALPPAVPRGGPPPRSGHLKESSYEARSAENARSARLRARPSTPEGHPRH